MSSQNRATRISKLHTLLKKAYKPIIPVDNRPLLEHLLYACLLENAPYELADEALAKLEQDYFDWNEVRVTTITELAEVLCRLPDPTAAAVRLKKNLHGLFESFYTFDIEELRKQNLGKALQRFERLPAMTPFVLDYLTQHGLGGHAIPLDSAALRFFWFADIVSESELKTGRVTGLERAIPKNKGVEFASLLHQAAVAINVDPNDQVARSIVLHLNPALDQQLADLIDRRRGDKALKESEAPEKVEVVASIPTSSKGKGKGAAATNEPSTPAAKQATAPEAKSSKSGPAKPTKQQAPKPQAEATPSKSTSAKTPKLSSAEKSTKGTAVPLPSKTGEASKPLGRVKSDDLAKATPKKSPKPTTQPRATSKVDQKKKPVKGPEKPIAKKSDTKPKAKPATPSAPKKKAPTSKPSPSKPSSKKITKKKPR